VKHLLIIFCITAFLLPSTAAQAAIVDEIQQNTPASYTPDTGIRNDLTLNAVQKAWDESDPRENVRQYTYDAQITYKVLLREFMQSTIVLPEGEEIVTASLGDSVNFKTSIIQPHIIEVWGKFAGADTSLILYGKSSNIYSFYLRNHSVRSKHVPHLVVYIEDKEIAAKLPQEKEEAVPVDDKPQEALSPEYLRELKDIDPANLNFKYKW